MPFFVECDSQAPPAWDDLVRADPAAGVYAFSESMRLFALALRATVVYASLRDEKFQLAGGFAFFEKSVWPTPFQSVLRIGFAFAPPIAKPGVDRKTLGRELSTALRARIRSRRLWSLGFSSAPHDHAADWHMGPTVRETQQNVVVDLLPSSDAQLASLDKSVRKNIRNAQSFGLTIQEASESDLDEFYRHYQTHHARLGLPIYPKAFFSGVRDWLAREQLGHFWIAKKDNAFVAGLAIAAFHNRLLELAIASDPAQHDLLGNDLLKWHAIEFGCSNGFSVFDLSNIDPVADAHSPTAGVNRFKKKWGRVADYPRYKILHPLVALFSRPA